MPSTKVVLYRELDGSVPLLDWLEELPDKAKDKCFVRLRRLAELGHELRRPEADFLREGIYELRIGFQGGNYRILYFFHGNLTIVASHGLVKERQVPPVEIDRAIGRMKRFVNNPAKHTLETPL
jgi:phage-related protein